MNIRKTKIENSTIIKPFDCGDDDLNEFLLEKSKDYQQELLAVTYVFEDETKTYAYYSIFNDCNHKKITAPVQRIRLFF